jgi:hypothetical protein
MKSFSLLAEDDTGTVREMGQEQRKDRDRQTDRDRE